MIKNITRREALKQMVASAAGIAAAGTVLESCGQKKPAEAQFEKTAKEGAKIVSRNWARLGDTVGLLGLGCMRLPKASDGSIDQEHTNKMVAYAIEHGINYFDTASGYAGSEEAMGKALSSHPRESYMIATKLSNHRSPVKSLEDGQKIFNSSLQKLQIEYFDFYLLHNLPSDAALHERFVDNGLLDWLIQQKKEGKIRHLGFSFHGNDREFMKILDGNYYDWDFVQIQMNYLDWENMGSKKPAAPGPNDNSAKFMYEELEKRGIPITIMEPIRGGALANVSDGMKAKLARRFPTLSPAGVALSYVASYPNVMCTLSGMSNMEQLEENVATFSDFKPFSAEDNAYLMQIAEEYYSNPHIACTGCEYCLPCPNGVNIPGNFKVFNTTSDELNIPDPDNQDADFKKKKKVFLTRYKKDLKDGMRADACTKCNVCLEKCPQHVRIPQQLEMINTLVKKLG